MIKFSCKKCGQKLNVEDKHSGKRVKCPKCGNISIVPDNSDKIKFQCENCGQSISVPLIHAGKKGKCPKCKNPVVIPSLKKESSESATYRPSVPSETYEDQYEEESDVSEEGAGVDRRLILFISGVAAIVVVGLILLVTVIHPSGPKQVEEQSMPPRQEVADTDLHPRPVVSDTQPTEPIVQEPSREKSLPEESISSVQELYVGNKIAFASDRDGNYEIYVMNEDGSGLKRLTNNPDEDVMPCWSPDGRKIAFESRRDGNPEIYIMNADGTEQTNLTNNSSWDECPSWSPDGRHIAFHSLKDENHEICVMNPDGSEQKRLTNNGTNDMGPSWSPDRKKIAFFAQRDGNPEIYVMNPDGSEQTRLTNNPARDTGPAWSPDGKITFTSNRDGNYEIYVMGADGSKQRKLTSNPANEGGASWSQDGKRIAFVSNRDGNREIYIMNSDGSEEKRVTNNHAEDRWPSWSPVLPSGAKEKSQKEESLSKEPVSLDDNLPVQTKIAFASDRDGNWEIYVMNMDGSGQRNLTNNPAPDGPPSWSHDGERIAFSSQRDRNGDIYVMNADGSGLERLTNDRATDGSPSWSLDGKKITFWSERDGNREIYTMNTDGSEQKRLTNSPAVDDQPYWSPDGKKIAFTSERDGDREIYVTNLDGSGLKRLTNNPDSDSSPCWSPDGEKIAFSSRRNGNLDIYVMSPDGSEQKKLTNNPAMDGSPCWSPDGEKIGFVSFRDGNPEIYVMNADGNEPRRLTNNPASDTFPSWSSYPFSEAEEQSQKEESLPKEPVSLEDKLTAQTKIAFASGKSKTCDIFIVNADGTELKNLTNNPARDDRPCFSPDGTKIAFTSYRDGERNSEIYVMYADGSEPINLTNHPAKDYNPSWSGTGDKIAFMSLRDRKPEIYVMNTDGNEQTRITHNKGICSYPCFSPDGTKIAFTWLRDGEREGGIYIINADGSELQRLTNNSAQDMQPCFSPDGTKIAFTSNRDSQREGEIYIMNADGSKQTRLTNNPKWDMAPCWSPDGKMIAFASGRDLSLEIYIMNADGSGVKRLTYLPASDSFPCWSPFLTSRSRPVDEPKGQRERPEITDKDVQPRLVSSEQSATDQNFNLKLRLKPSQKHRLRLYREYNSSHTVKGQQYDSNSALTAELEFEVGQIDANGVVSLKVTHLRFNETTKTDRGRDEYDSAKPDTIDNSFFGPIFSALIGQSFVVKVTPEGRIVKIEGLAEMYQQMAEPLVEYEDEAIRQKHAGMGTKGSEENAKQLIDRANQKYGSREQRIEATRDTLDKGPYTREDNIRDMLDNVIMSFPGRLVGVGDSWMGTPFSMGNMELGDCTYTLRETNQTTLLVNISSKLKVDNEVPASADGSRGSLRTTLAGSIQGYIQIEPNTGWMLRKNMSLHYSGEKKTAPTKQNPRGITTSLSMENITTVEPIE